MHTTHSTLLRQDDIDCCYHQLLPPACPPAPHRRLPPEPWTALPAAVAWLFGTGCRRLRRKCCANTLERQLAEAGLPYLAAFGRSTSLFSHFTKLVQPPTMHCAFVALLLVTAGGKGCLKARLRAFSGRLPLLSLQLQQSALPSEGPHRRCRRREDPRKPPTGPQNCPPHFLPCCRRRVRRAHPARLFRPSQESGEFGLVVAGGAPAAADSGGTTGFRSLLFWREFW